MNFSKFLTQRFLLFFGIYLGMLILANVIKLPSLISQTYQKLGAQFFSDYPNGGEVYFNENKKGEDKTIDTVIAITSKSLRKKTIDKARKQGLKNVELEIKEYPIGTWGQIGLIYLFFLSLVLASPISWKRRLITLVIGCLLITIFVFFKTIILLQFIFAKSYALFEVGVGSQFGLKVLNVLNNIIQIPYFGYMIALLLWVILALPKITSNLSLNEKKLIDKVNE